MMKIAIQEFPKSQSNKTEFNKTDFSENDPINPYLSDVIGQMNSYRNLIRENISYECFMSNSSCQKEELDELVELMVDVMVIHTCGAYLYVSNGVSSNLPEHFFEKEPWYVRLVLEGEDRLDRNQRAKEQERTVSYSAVSEEWEAIGNAGGNPLECLVHRENMKEILRCLTERQRAAVSLCFFQQKSRKEAAGELGISSPAVSAILLQAARRLRKKYPSGDQAEKAVATV